MFWEQAENGFRDDLRNKGGSYTFRKFTEGILWITQYKYPLVC